jgi:saccharopine dehydrogenase-like NADP-dependent oxidoreductase
LAAAIVDDLDQVDDLITGWGEGDQPSDNAFDSPGNGGSYRAALEHLVHQITSDIMVWQNAALRITRPVQKVAIDYPGGIQKTVYTVGHPEPVTLYKLRPEIKNCLNVVDLPEALIDPLLWMVDQVRKGRMTTGKAVRQMLTVERGALAMLTSTVGRKILWKAVALDIQGHRQQSLPGLFAYASGVKAGRPARVSAHLKATPFGGLERETMGSLTGVPLAVGLHLFADRHSKPVGVFAPESVFDPHAFFNRLAPLCTPKQKDAVELIVKREVLE